VVVLLLAILGAVAVGLPALIDGNHWREALGHRLSQASGRVVTIDGPVSWELLPQPELTLHGVTIGGQGAVVLAHLSRVEAEFAWWPLLLGRVEPERLEISEPALELAGPPLAAAPGAETPAPGVVNGPAPWWAGLLQVDHLIIHNGRVVWRDAEGEQARLGGLDAELTAGDPEQPLALQGALTAGGSRWEVAGVVGRLAESGGVPLRLTLSAPKRQASAVFAGVFTPAPNRGGRLDGDLRIESSDLPQLVQGWSTESVGVGAGTSDEGSGAGEGGDRASGPALPLKLRAGLTVLPGFLELSRLQLQAGSLNASGGAWLVPGRPSQAELQLSLGTVALEPWLSLIRSRLPASAPSSTPTPAVPLSARAGDDSRLPQGLAGRVVSKAALAALSPAPLPAATATAATVGGRSLAGVPVAAPPPPPAPWWPWCLPGALTARIEIDAEGLDWRGQSLHQVRLLASLADRALQLEQVSALGPGGSDWSLTGVLASLPGCAPRADLRLSVRQPEPGGGATDPGTGQLQLHLSGGPDQFALAGAAGRGDGRAQLEGTLSVAGAAVGGANAASAAGAGGGPRLVATVQAAHPRLVELIRWAMPELAPESGASGGALGEVLGGFDLHGRVIGQAGRWQVSALTGSVDGVAVSGRAALSLGGARPRLDAAFDLDQLGLERWWPMALMPPVVDRATRWLEAAEGSLSLQARSARWHEWQIERPVLEARLEDGVLTVSRCEGALAGGQVALSGRMVALGTTPQADLTLSVADVPLVLAGVRGRLDLDAALSTGGGGQTGLLAGLNGSGTVLLRQGLLAGIDLAPAREPPGGRRSLSGPGTAFARLGGAFRVSRGVVRSDALILESAEESAGDGARDWARIGGQGQGELDLARQVLELRLSLAPTLEPPPPPVTVTLSGTLAQPAYQVEAGAFNTWLLQRRGR